MLRLPLKRRPRFLLLPKYSSHYPIRGICDSRLAMADELCHMVFYSNLNWRLDAIEPGSAITQAVAIKLRGRGPSADYMAAILACEARTKVAPGRDLSQIIAEKRKYTQLSQETLLQKSRGCWTFVCICRWIRESTDGPPPAALCRELLMPQMQMQRLTWLGTPYQWIDWKETHETEMRPD